LLTRYGTAPKVGGRPSTLIFSVSCNKVIYDVRYDGKEQLVLPTPKKKGEDVLVKDVLQVISQCAVSVS
jgi:hypothetical protein